MEEFSPNAAEAHEGHACGRFRGSSPQVIQDVALDEVAVAAEWNGGRGRSKKKGRKRWIYQAAGLDI